MLAGSIQSLLVTVHERQAEIGQLQQRLQETETAERALRSAASGLEDRISALKRATIENEAGNSEVVRKLSLINISVTDLEKEILMIENQVKEQYQARDTKAALIGELHSSLKLLAVKNNELKESSAAAEQKLMALAEPIADVGRRLALVGLENAAPDEGDIERLRREEVTEEQGILEITESISRLKGARRKTECESALSKLMNAENVLSEAQKANIAEANKLVSAIAKAENWVSLLMQIVKSAVTDRLNQHRIESFRLFQSMIPTPYLFDNISITDDTSGVRLGLHYRGQVEDVGEPRFFLSSAQANVLALSYFLSFASRQCWCRLRTVLMDDPVQHLDDLDAVALLDLLRTLMSRENRSGRQLIMSTCDYNLYALMIRKFGGISPGKMTFSAYSIHDMGVDGPVIRKDMENGSPTAQAA
ncbi:MAG: hypothetical protein BGO12_13745 [Verrucomicrobia bacterium 61-8]|nr:MAG: hypothetical protein BGO12_13745 [Verrucomicrobia bacterium 61-8]